MLGSSEEENDTDFIRRNKNWALKIINFVRIFKHFNEISVICGCSHLTGKVSILELLSQGGFKIEMYDKGKFVPYI